MMKKLLHYYDVGDIEDDTGDQNGLNDHQLLKVVTNTFRL